MAIAVRVRVVWDDTTVEDRVFAGRRLRIGAGPLATTPAPGQEGRYATLLRRGGILELTIPPGGADAVEFPGEERVELCGLTTTFVRRLQPPFGSGRLFIGGAVVEFERVVVGDQSGDRALYAYAAAALALSLMAGGSYKLVRLFGDGDKPQWGRPPSISNRDASAMRVRIGPEGAGASRPQAGRGVALHGTNDGRHGSPTPPNRVIARAPDAVPPVAGRPKRVVRPGRGSTPLPVGVEGGVPTEVQPIAVKTPPVKEPSREQVVEDAQSALLAADLRKAIDSFSRAARSAPLDYDQLNWLGLAHYLTGEYGEAETVWSQARTLDPGRPDAINNLASVAKRRGDTPRELEHLEAALKLQPNDCHASNSLALAQAKASKVKDALATLAASDTHCGGNYAYTAIQKAGILSMQGDQAGALKELENGLARVDTLIPIKEFEVLTDLRLDPAFATLRSQPRFAELVSKYLPRAATWKL